MENSFFYMAEHGCATFVYLFTRDGQLDCFHLLAIMNTVTNICVQVFVWTYVFIFLGYLPRGGNCWIILPWLEPPVQCWIEVVRVNILILFLILDAAVFINYDVHYQFLDILFQVEEGPPFFLRILF